MFYINIYGKYNPNQPRISRIAETIKKDRPIKFIVSSGRSEGLIAVGGKTKAGFILNSSRYIKKNLSKDDILLGYMHAGAVGAYLGKKPDIKFWYDYPDPWRGWYYYKSKEDTIKWKLGRRAFYFLEKRIVRSANCVTTASQAQLNFLEEQHERLENKEIIYNCPDTQLFNPENRDPNLKERLGLENQNILIHIGSIAAEYGADILIKTLERIKKEEKNTKLIFLGTCPDKSFERFLHRLINKKGLKNDVIFNKVPYQKVPHYLNIADVGYISFRDRFYNHLGGANKLFEYMATGIGIISADMSGFRLMVRDNENLLFAKPEDENDFAAKTVTLLEDTRLRNRLRKNNLKLINEKYNWSLQIKKIKHVLNILDSS